MLIELTSSYTGKAVALEAGIIGEVKDLSAEIGRTLGKSMLIHVKNRRVHWLVNEEYPEVMRRIREGTAAVISTGPDRLMMRDERWELTRRTKT